MKSSMQQRRRVRLEGLTDREDAIYVVPVSGGKDSQLVLARTTDRFGTDPERVYAVHNYTGYDHSLTYAHLSYLEDRYGVRIEYSGNPRYEDIRDLMNKKTMIPGRTARFCTDELKIQAFNHWLLQFPVAKRARMVVLFGMRAPESDRRAERYSGVAEDDEFSLRDLNPHKVWKSCAMVRARLPIVQMTTTAVFEELRARGDRVNGLYARGHQRVGCYPCILAGVREFRRCAADPEGRERIIELASFKEMLRHAKGYNENVTIEHDLERILEGIDDPFGFGDAAADEEQGGCQWCAM